MKVRARAAESGRGPDRMSPALFVVREDYAVDAGGFSSAISGSAAASGAAAG